MILLHPLLLYVQQHITQSKEPYYEEPSYVRLDFGWEIEMHFDATTQHARITMSTTLRKHFK